MTEINVKAETPSYYLYHTDSPRWRKLYLNTGSQVPSGCVEFDPKTWGGDNWENLLSEEHRAILNRLPWAYELTLSSPVNPEVQIKGMRGITRVRLPVGSKYPVIWVTPEPDKQGVTYATIVFSLEGEKQQFTTLVALNNSHIYRKYTILREGVRVERHTAR